MEMKIPLIAISAFVVVVVLGAVLMPVLTDATKTEDTYTNEGYFHMDVIDTSVSRTIYWDHTKPNEITIDTDHVVQLPTDVSATLVCSGDNWMVRHTPNSLIQLYITNGGVSATVTDGTDMTISISSGTLTATNTASTPVSKSVTFTSAYCVTYDESSDYVMKKNNVSAYMNSDSTYFGMGRSNIGTYSGVPIVISGTVENVTITDVSSNNASFSNVEIVSSEVSGHEDLYLLDKITFTGTIGEQTADLTYSYFIVPSEVTAERSVQLTANESAILAAIPALVIVALLIGVLAVWARSKMD